MKKDSYCIQKILFWIMVILAVILAALLIHKGYTLYKERIHQEELNVRNQEVQSEIDDMQTQIKELSEDGEALQQFLNDKIDEASGQSQPAKEQRTQEPPVQEALSDSVVTDGRQTEEASEQGQSVSENGQPGDESYSGDAAIIIDVPEKANPAETISGNGMTDGQVISSQHEETEITSEEKRNIRTSYLETMMVNGEDKAVISNGTIDFSGMKIACLGDSLTAGDNLEDIDDYQKYVYPSVLKSILNAEEVYNLGIGGSSYGRYWDEAFVDRYKEIPEDSDIILVMGGTNDGFSASIDELGNINERKPRTFYGDVDELMRGLKEKYPDAKIIFATPLPNILHDYLMSQRDYLLPQSLFADAVKELAAEYGIDVIDLYNSNILDTHDSQVISSYMPDGVHGNPAGYQILAEHLASGIIHIMENDALSGTVSENSAEAWTVSGNSAEAGTVSGNGTGSPVSGNAVIVATPTEQSETSAPQGSAPSSGGEDSTNKKQETKNSYEYGGEAIIIN